MSVLLKDIENEINKCINFDELSDAIILYTIENKCFNHCYEIIRNKMNQISSDLSYSKIIHTLLHVSYDSSCEDSAKKLLKYLSDRLSNNIETELHKLTDDISDLLIVIVLSEYKNFISKIPEDILIKVIRLLGKIFKYDLIAYPNEDYDKIDKLLTEWTYDMVITPDIQKNINNYIDQCKDINQDLIQVYVQPMLIEIRDIITNSRQDVVISALSTYIWNVNVEDMIEKASLNFYNKGLGSEIADQRDIKLIYLSLIIEIKRFIDTQKSQVNARGIPNIFVNKEVGEHIYNIWKEIELGYEFVKDEKNMILILIECYRICENISYIDSATKSIIERIITLVESFEFPNVLFQDPIKSAVEIYLSSDKAYKYFSDVTQYDMKEGTANYLYSRYLINPKAVFSDIFNITQESIIMEASKSTKNDYIEDDGDDDEESSKNDPNAYDEIGRDEDYKMRNKRGNKKYKIEASQDTKKYSKSSKMVDNAQKKIYGAYKNYKNNEQKVDSQLTKMLNAAKKAFSGDKTEEIIEGKKFTPIGLLKKILVTGAIFSYSKVAGFVYLLTKHTLGKKRTEAQKKEILLQIETEIKMLEEKIEDARGDGNRQAKYALMRTKAELERARDKIKFNLSATKEDMKTAKTVLSKNKYI